MSRDPLLSTLRRAAKLTSLARAALLSTLARAALLSTLAGAVLSTLGGAVLSTLGGAAVLHARHRATLRCSRTGLSAMNCAAVLAGAAVLTARARLSTVDRALRLLTGGVPALLGWSSVDLAARLARAAGTPPLLPGAWMLAGEAWLSGKTLRALGAGLRLLTWPLRAAGRGHASRALAARAHRLAGRVLAGQLRRRAARLRTCAMLAWP